MAYRRVLEGQIPFIDEDLLRGLESGSPSISDVRLVATAFDAGIFHKHGYIRAAQDAVRLAPNEPASHFIYARVYAEFGRFRDAKSEVDAAAALLSAPQAAKFQTYATKLFYFDRLDHGSKGVIGKDGKLTVTYFKLPLPNSSEPLVEPVATGVSVKP